MSALLCLEDIKLCFNRNVVFEKLNFTLAENSIVVIETGVLDGGTSLLKICNATLSPEQGKVYFGDRLSTQLSTNELFQQVGMQFESEGLLSMYTVLENCKLPLSFHSHLSDDVIVEQIVILAAKFGFTHLLDKYPYQLNDVQLRLANLLRLLVIAPKVFLLDEIQAGMSGILRNSILSTLVEHLKETQRSMIMTITAGDVDSFTDTKYQIIDNRLVRS
ncbi:MAG: hypothetical protein COB35_02535 [Gammaproteobacteria bacterium]|nr:MAG: hypothetical protein COB35_02535 [Gammaproteobacteria bacterium]